MVSSHLTALSVPEYWPDIRLTSFEGIPSSEDQTHILSFEEKISGEIIMVLIENKFLTVEQMNQELKNSCFPNSNF